MNKNEKKYKLYYLYEVYSGNIFYIGKTSQDLEARRRRHLSDAFQKNDDKWRYYYRNVNKIRKIIKNGNDFNIEAFMYFDDENECFNKEMKYIQWCKNIGINITNNTLGGEGRSGMKLTNEQRKKISEASKKNWSENYEKMYNALNSEEAWKKKKKKLKGRSFTKEHLKNLSEARKGKNVGKDNPMYGMTGSAHPLFGKKRPEHSKWMKENFNPLTGSANKNSLKIKQFDLDGKLIKRFDSIAEASKDNKIHQPNIINCLKGKNVTAGGYIWRYENDDFYKFETCAKNRPKSVIQLDKKGSFINEFSSFREAVRNVKKTDVSSIINCCRGKRKTSGGFVWKYKIDYKKK